MKVEIRASDFYVYFRPTRCALRVFLREKGENESPPGPYEEVMQRLGIRHEKDHLATFPSFVDLSSIPASQRGIRTKEEIEKATEVIYHPSLKASSILDGIECIIWGEPDFLIRKNEGYIIRDSKISRRITEKDHPEIMFQLGIYAWLFKQVAGHSALGLEVHSGTGEIIEIPYDGENWAFQVLREILSYRLLESEPYSPVGWSKCGGCGFSECCLDQAKRKKDVALVVAVDQGLSIALREQGIRTIDELLERFDEETLSNFQRPWGEKTQRVGKRAGLILRSARSMSTGKEYILSAPAIPPYSNYVMFDLEGLPPQFDELEKIYLWGLKVFGENPSKYYGATSGFGVDGDKQGWEDFLKNAAEIFKEYGDIPFVHWHSYESARLSMYVKRYGDPTGIAERVKKNLVDLLPITRDSIVLPLPSYSLKVVEKYIGYKRTQDEYGGDWAMARYIEAVETENEKERSDIMEQILQYNLEDLEATWAVLNWLKSKTP